MRRRSVSSIIYVVTLDLDTILLVKSMSCTMVAAKERADRGSMAIAIRDTFAWLTCGTEDSQAAAQLSLRLYVSKTFHMSRHDGQDIRRIGSGSLLSLVSLLMCFDRGRKKRKREELVVCQN